MKGYREKRIKKVTGHNQGDLSIWIEKSDVTSEAWSVAAVYAKAEDQEAQFSEYDEAQEYFDYHIAGGADHVTMLHVWIVDNGDGEVAELIKRYRK